MKKTLIAAVFSCVGFSAHAAPDIDFSTMTGMGAFNTAQNTSYLYSNIDITAWEYLGGGGGTPEDAYTQSGLYLWMRNNTNDHGLGVCSGGAGSANECDGMSTTTTGGGDNNELGNNVSDEVIRLDNQTGQDWSDVWISSLDSSEKATIYWTNDEWADLDSLATKITVSAGYWGSTSIVEGSIWSALTGASNWDLDSQYLFFRAGGPGAGTDNDYLVWGVSAIPEPETYAMLLAGLGLLGFAARRRKQKQAA